MGSCDICPLCLSVTEDCLHLFHDCSISHAFWESTVQGAVQGQFVDCDWDYWVSSNIMGGLSGSSDVDWPRFYVSALSAIWRMRNEWVFNHTPLSSQRIWGLLKLLGMEQKASTDALQPLHATQGQQPGTFECQAVHRASTNRVRPDFGWVKVNVDGAVSTTLGASCGGVIRNAEGGWLKGFSRNLGYLAFANVFLSELLAVRYDVELVLGLDLPSVIVESDSLEVIQLLSSPDLAGPRYEHLAVNILQLQTAHDNMVFQHTPREANSLADYLDKIGLDLQFGEHLFDASFGECHSLLVKDSPSVAHPPGDPA